MGGSNPRLNKYSQGNVTLRNYIMIIIVFNMTTIISPTQPSLSHSFHSFISSTIIFPWGHRCEDRLAIITALMIMNLLGAAVAPMTGSILAELLGTWRGSFFVLAVAGFGSVVDVFSGSCWMLSVINSVGFYSCWMLLLNTFFNGCFFGVHSSVIF